MPFLLLLSGPPGSGKTTLRQELIRSGQFNLTVLDIDDIADAMVGSGREGDFRPKIEPKIVAALLALARTNLRCGNAVIIDSPWTVYFHRHPQVIQQLQDVINDTGARLLMIQLKPTEACLRAQIVERNAERDQPKIADERSWQTFLDKDFVGAENPMEQINSGLKEKARQIVIQGNDGRDADKDASIRRVLSEAIQFLNDCSAHSGHSVPLSLSCPLPPLAAVKW